MDERKIKRDSIPCFDRYCMASISPRMLSIDDHLGASLVYKPLSQNHLCFDMGSRYYGECRKNMEIVRKNDGSRICLMAGIINCRTNSNPRRNGMNTLGYAGNTFGKIAKI